MYNVYDANGEQSITVNAFYYNENNSLDYHVESIL